MVIMVVGSDGTDGDHITVVGSGGMVVMVLWNVLYLSTATLRALYVFIHNNLSPNKNSTFHLKISTIISEKEMCMPKAEFIFFP